MSIGWDCPVGNYWVRTAGGELSQGSHAVVLFGREFLGKLSGKPVILLVVGRSLSNSSVVEHCESYSKRYLQSRTALNITHPSPIFTDYFIDEIQTS